MPKAKKFSKHISWKEATGSATAKKLEIDNTPNDEQLNNMQDLAEDLFEPLRERVGEPILINSFFRCEELNKAISGSATTSQHIKGCAIDLDATKISNCELFYIIKNEFEFDKLIWELGDDNNPDWIHVSYVKGNNRGLVYQAKRKPGKGFTTYHPFNLDQIEDE
jgi:zinc D-Ala-D-Ala carboxypeptidase